MCSIIIDEKKQTLRIEISKPQEEPDKINLLKEISIKHKQLGTITCLDLSHCALKDLPRDVKLSYLQQLNLAHNELQTVPLWLYGNRMKHLTLLDLSYNQINNFYVEPDCIESLKTLRLSNNLFENVPPWFLLFRCINLEEFDYSSNKAKHYNFLNHICNFSIMKLEKLELRDSCLVNKDAIWLKSIKNLKYLDISRPLNQLNRTNINKLNDLNQLFVTPRWRDMNVLRLDNLSLTLFPEGIFWVETLTELYISHNFLPWFPDGIQYLVNLRVLDISCNGTILIPPGICKLECLEILLASENCLDEAPIIASLQTLDLYGNNIQELNLDTLSNVEYLDLEMNYTDMSIAENRCYNARRDAFRSKYNHSHRITGAKQPEDLNSDYKFGSSSESSFNDSASESIRVNDLDEEDWDADCSKELTGEQNVLSTDEEFEGKEESVRYCVPKSICYVQDEDWMFEDAD